MRRGLLLLVVFCISFSTLGQQDDKSIVRSDTINKGGNLKLIGVPVIFSTPETGFGFGGGGQLFLTSEKNIFGARKSNIFFSSRIYNTACDQLNCMIPPVAAG